MIDQMKYVICSTLINKNRIHIIPSYLHQLSSEPQQAWYQLDDTSKSSILTTKQPNNQTTKQQSFLTTINAQSMATSILHTFQLVWSNSLLIIVKILP